MRAFSLYFDEVPVISEQELEKLSASVDWNLSKLPDHDAFIKQHCSAQN